MESILQKDKERCFICGMNGYVEPLDEHHVFFGSMRSKSDRYGLTVYLHHNRCHLDGVHKNARLNRKLQAYAQRKAMEHYEWDTERFIKEFYKNYLEE